MKSTGQFLGRRVSPVDEVQVVSQFEDDSRHSINNIFLSSKAARSRDMKQAATLPFSTSLASGDGPPRLALQLASCAQVSTFPF